MSKLKINYGADAKITKITSNPLGTDIWFDCWKVPILFNTEPNWTVGDTISISFERRDECPPSPITNPPPSSNS